MKRQTVKRMRNITRVFSILAAMVFASAAAAQDDLRADHTVVSVLRMAKDLTETVSARGTQSMLRFAVARSIQETRHEAAFGSYVVDAYKKPEQMLPSSVRENPHWIKNRELEEEAKRALLAGDPERAKQLLLQCYEIHHWYPCLTIDLFVQVRFLSWELDAGHLSAALDRFKANDWKTLKDAAMLRVVRAHIIAGRQSDIADLLSELDGSFRKAEQLGRLGAGAALRTLAMTGNVNAAMEGALSQPGISERVVGLLIVAESLAGLPGLPEEPLQRF